MINKAILDNAIKAGGTMYKVSIFTTCNTCREFIVTDYDYAMRRIAHYKNDYPYYKFHSLSCFNGECWVELP